MASIPLNNVLRHVQKVAASQHCAGRTDAELLGAFIARRDERAFAALVERHGAMVLGVCRHLLHHLQDAEDAFQATFLVLARNAGSIRKSESLASWLHGVAYRMALKAKRDAARRRVHERQAQLLAKRKAERDLTWREVQAALDEEVQRLAEKYRTPFVLCGLEGRSCRDAAGQLGLKEGTVWSRLAEARKRLHEALARRGIALAALVAAVGVAREAGAGVPAILAARTVHAAVQVVAGHTAAGVISVQVADLIEGELRTMFATKCKIGLGFILATSLLAAGAMGLRHQALAQPQGNASSRQAQAEPRPADGAKPAHPAAKPDEEDTMAVRGRVLDPNGKPVRGARIYLSYYQGDRAKPKQRATSGDNGDFQFTFARSEVNPHYAWFTDEGWRRADIVAVAEDYGPQWIQAGAIGTDEVTLRLVKDDVPIEGRILDLEGQPVAGATVKVVSIVTMPDEDLTDYLKTRRLKRSKALSPMTAGLTGTLTTGKDGRFRLTGIGRERVVELDVSGPTLENVGFVALSRTGVDEKVLNRRRPEDTSPLLDEPRPRTIHGAQFDHLVGPTKPFVGTVRDKGTGKPLVGIRISMADQYGKGYYRIETVTDAKGQFRLVGWPKLNHYRLVAAREGNAGYLTAYHSTSDTEGLQPITVDFELIRGVVVQGRLRDRDTGKPVRGHVTYRALPENKHLDQLPDKDYHTSARESGDGTYRLVALPGPGLLLVRNEEGLFMHVRLDPADKAKGHTVDTLDLENSHAYRLIAAPKAGETLTCDFELVRGKTRCVTLSAPDGKPLTGVSICGLHDQLLQTQAVASATFTADGLDPDRPRRITFLHAERQLAGYLTLRGDEPEPVSVKLEPWGSVIGRVLDDNGKPLVAGRVDVYHRTRESRAEVYVSHRLSHDTILTDQDGRFRVEGLIPGLEYEVVVVKRGAPGSRNKWFERVKVKSGQTTDLGEAAVKKPTDL